MEAGFLLGLLQRRQTLGLPHSRPMPGIGARCHELRVIDHGIAWRIVYRLDPDAVVILYVFEKKTTRTPKRVIEVCRARLRGYDGGTRS